MFNNWSSMIGWRGRIGLIIPETNTVMEADFNRYAPMGVSIYASRMKRNSPISSIEGNLEMLTYAEMAASLLVSVEADINVFGCTAASFLSGVGGDIALAKKLQKATGITTITTATAIINALKSLRIQKICLITPYIHDITVKEVDFFNKNGFEVVNYSGLGIEKTIEMGRVPPEGIYRFVKKNIIKTEAVVISCTTFRSMEIIKLLEKDIGIPVITSNQASLWYALQHLGVSDDIDGVGRLFNH